MGLLVRMFSEHAERDIRILEFGACKKKFPPQIVIHGEMIVSVQAHRRKGPARAETKPPVGLCDRPERQTVLTRTRSSSEWTLPLMR